jgi:hypothetical protein
MRQVTAEEWSLDNGQSTSNWLFLE